MFLNMVHRVVAEWEEVIDVKLKWEDGNVGLVRVTFDGGPAIWSLVGKQILKAVAGQPTMNLGGIDDTKDTSTDERGRILHAFGHTFGLQHEHQNPDEVSLPTHHSRFGA